MEQKRNQCRELHSTCMKEEKDIKKKFTKIVNYINGNNLKLSSDCKKNLKGLIQQWNKKDKNTDDYFDMKNFHTYITGELDELGGEIKELWDDYLMSGLTFRTKLMHLNHEIQSLNS